MKINNLLDVSIIQKSLMLLALIFASFFFFVSEASAQGTWVYDSPCVTFGNALNPTICGVNDWCGGFAVSNGNTLGVSGSCSPNGLTCMTAGMIPPPGFGAPSTADKYRCVVPAASQVNCVGSWSSYGSCSASCGGGTQTRTYNITTPASGGGAACPYTQGATQSQACNTQACALSSCTGTPINNCIRSTVPSGGTSGSCASGYTQGSCSYSCNNGNWTLNGNTCAIPSAPTVAPSNLSVSAGGCGTGQLTVSWSPVAGASHYRIEVDGVGLSNQIFGTNYPHYGLTPGSSHSYRVYTQYPSNSSGWSSYVSGTAPNSCPVVTYSCQGSLPSNSSLYFGDNSGLSSNTNYSHSYSDTAPKCQYYCNSGYQPSGSSCVAIPPQPLSVSFTTDRGNNPTINRGDNLNLIWQTANANFCNATGGWSGSKTENVLLSQSVSPTTNTTYNLTCGGVSGSSYTATVNVTVNQPAPPPPSGPINTPDCLIPVNASSCPSNVSWGPATGVVTCSISQNGTTFNNSCSGNVGRTLTYNNGNQHIFQLTVRDQNAINSGWPGDFYFPSFARASCASGSAWNGSICADTTPPASGSVSAGGCSIAAGNSNCVSSVNWSTSNFVGSASISQNGAGFSAAGGSTFRAVGFGVTDFVLRDLGSSFSANARINVGCVEPSSWNGSSCAAPIPAPNGSVTATPSPCVVSIGQSTCNVNVNWNSTNNTNPILTENGSNLSGSATGNTVRNLTPNTYVYILRSGATELNRATASVTCQFGSSWNGSICLSNTPPPNQLPVVNAGADRVITLPTSATSPSGASATDPDGSIVNLAWTFVGGPSAPGIGNGSTLAPTFSGMTIPGTYNFRLTATDNRGGSSNDTMSVSVAPQPSYICSPLPGNTSFHAGDDIGLSANTASAYSLSDTNVRCQFICSSAVFQWNGSSCVLPPIPAVPSGLSAATPCSAPSRIDLTWNAVPGATSYEVLINGGPGGATRVVTNYSHSGLTPGNSYFYQVRASGPSGNSAYSARVNAVAPSACLTPLSDLQSGVLSVSGSLNQGQNVTFNSRVQNNTAITTGVAFDTEFSYRWGGVGGWNRINVTNQSALAGNQSRNTNSSNFALNGYGNLEVQHCVDSSPERINETNEGNNCVVATYNVIQAASAPVLVFLGNPLTINSGQVSNLRWNVTGADSCTASAVPAANTGSNSWSGAKNSNTGVLHNQNVSPLVTTTYSLSCSRGGLTTTQTVEVRVNPPIVTGPQMGSLIANPNNVASGGNVNLNYNKGPDFQLCSIYNLADISFGFGVPLPRLGSTAISVLNFGPRAGSVRVNPTTDTTYVLLCLQGNNPGFFIGNGTPYIAGQDSVTVTGALPPPTTDIKANGSDGPITINSGDAVNLVGSFAGPGLACSISTGGGPLVPYSGTGLVNLTTNPVISTTYNLSCFTAFGTGGGILGALGGIGDSVSVTVNPVAQPNLAPGVIIGNGTLTQGQTASFNSSVVNNGSVSTPGSFTAQFSHSFDRTTWTPFTTTNHAPLNGISAGGNTRADNSAILNLGQAGQMWVRYCVDSPTNQITEANEGDNCLEQDFTIASAPVPPSINLNTSDNTIIQGDSATLTWTVTDAVSCIATGGWSGVKNPSGGTESVSPVVTTTYTLTCTGAGGNSSGNVTITVNLPTGDLTGVGCSVLAGASSCSTASLGWTGVNAISPYISNQTNPSSAVYNGISMPNGSRSGITLSLGTITMLLRSGSFTIDSADLSAGCALGTFRLGNTCQNPPRVTLTIDDNDQEVPNGRTKTVRFEVEAPYAVSCTITGVANTSPIVHSGTPSIQTYTRVTKPLKSKQIVTVSCEPSPVVSGVTPATASDSINVSPTVEEI